MSEGKKKYDFAIPLGAACASSIALRAANMQFASLPFDWTGGGDIVGRAKLIAGGFADWMRLEDMELTDVLHATFNSSIYRNRVTGLTYPHDFPAGCYLEDELPTVVGKYERRIRRLYSEMERAGHALAVYNEVPYRPVAPDADLLEAHRLLQERFPKTQIDLLYFAQDPDCADREPQVLSDSVTKVVLDYHSVASGYVSTAALYHRIVQYLMQHAEVPDSRTPEEIARHQAAAEARQARRWGTGVTKWVNKRAYHLYRHLERFLAKRGCVPNMERPLKMYKERGERRPSPKEPDVSFLPRDEAAVRAAYDLL